MQNLLGRTTFVEQKKKDAYADILLNLKPYNEKADDQKTGKT